jgi:hypothetical protein
MKIQLQKNAPEFEELAAMQSGFGTIIARPARYVLWEPEVGDYLRPPGGRIAIAVPTVTGPVTLLEVVNRPSLF